MPARVLAASPLLSGKEQKGTTGKAGAPHLTLSRPGSVRRCTGLASPGHILALANKETRSSGFSCILPKQQVPSFQTGFWKGLHLWVIPDPQESAAFSLRDRALWSQVWEHRHKGGEEVSLYPPDRRGP